MPLFVHETWRSFLYPLGFIASFLFSIRFIIQWIASERKKESTVPISFWIFSLVANILMCVHTFIQVQYPFCIIQVCNAIISWRNLNLMKELSKQRSLKFTLLLIATLTSLITLLFIVEGLYLYGEVDWIRTPLLPWQEEANSPLPLAWHLVGFIGAAIFAMRFWLQWLEIEQHRKSFLSTNFWLWSLIGATIALIYFIRLGDLVNILGYGLGIIPYIRNLVLIRKARRV